MDARSLGLREDLRVWYDNGLRFVFCDRYVEAVRPAAVQQPQTSTTPARRSQPRRMQTPGKPAQQTRSARPERPAPAAPTPPPVPQPTASESGGELSVFPWDEFRPRLGVPSRTVWTYWELGLDFGPNPDVDRRELFKAIIKNLHWPGGSLTFWPLSFPNQGALIGNKGSFLRGVRETGADTVICFGEKAFRTLFPRERFVHGRHGLPGLTVIALPGPGAMLSGDAQAKRIVWDTLRGLSF